MDETKKEINPPIALEDRTTWVSMLKPGNIIVVNGTVFEIKDIRGQSVRIAVRTHRDHKIHVRK